jgi:peptidoglycan/LPS O-acetylase OafA/YrhL
MSSRLRSIDFLRGVAAFSVAFGHAVIATPNAALGLPWFTAFCDFTRWLTATGVALFFVISGFCIHLAQLRRGGADAFHWAGFWKRRIWRLYPTYFVVLCVSMGLLVMMFLSGTGSEVVAKYPEPRLRWMAIDFGVHALMLHGFHPFFDQAGGNAPFWTLAREEYLYLMYPLILAVRRVAWWRVASAMAALTIVIDVAAPRLLSAAWAQLLVTSAPALWIQWQLGAVAAEGYRGSITLPRLFYDARLIPAWIAMAYLAPFEAIWLGFAYFTAVNACVRRDVEGHWPVAGWVGAVTTMGLWSYSLYLVNDPIHTVALSLLLRLGDVSGPLLFMVRASVMTAISCGAAYVLFLLVERHFIPERRRAVAVVNVA